MTGRNGQRERERSARKDTGREARMLKSGRKRIASG